MNRLGFVAIVIAALLAGNSAMAGDRHHKRDGYHHGGHYRDHDRHGGKHHYRGPKHVYHHHYHGPRHYAPRYYAPRYYAPAPVYYGPAPVYYPAPRYGSGVSGTISVHF